MAQSYASTVIDAPAPAVWARIRDFNGLADRTDFFASQVFQGGFDALAARFGS